MAPPALRATERDREDSDQPNERGNLQMTKKDEQFRHSKMPGAFANPKSRQVLAPTEDQRCRCGVSSAASWRCLQRGDDGRVVSPSSATVERVDYECGHCHVDVCAPGLIRGIIVPLILSILLAFSSTVVAVSASSLPSSRGNRGVGRERWRWSGNEGTGGGHAVGSGRQRPGRTRSKGGAGADYVDEHLLGESWPAFAWWLVREMVEVVLAGMADWAVFGAGDELGALSGLKWDETRPWWTQASALLLESPPHIRRVLLWRAGAALLAIAAASLFAVAAVRALLAGSRVLPTPGAATRGELEHSKESGDARALGEFWWRSRDREADILNRLASRLPMGRSGVCSLARLVP